MARDYSARIPMLPLYGNEPDAAIPASGGCATRKQFLVNGWTGQPGPATEIHSGPGIATDQCLYQEPFLCAEAIVITRLGEKPAWSLAPGDEVLTRDNGYQPIRRVAMFRCRAENSALIRVEPGALGPASPSRPLLVGPAQRFLVSVPNSIGGCTSQEALAYAGLLVFADGVDCHEGGTSRLVQLLLPQHELILANGAWTETLAPHAADNSPCLQVRGDISDLQAM